MISDLIKLVQELIDSGRGDIGRIEFILSCLKRGRPLYKSDQQYIEKLLAEPIKRIHTPESIWMTQQKVVEEEKKKVELDELKTKVTLLDDKVEEIAKKTAEPSPQKAIYRYSSARTTGYLAIFYVGVVLITIGTVIYQSAIFSTLQIAVPENFTQYTIEVAIGIIIVYTVLAHSKDIQGLLLKLVNDTKDATVEPSQTTKGQDYFA